MNKYKLVNITTKEETICDRVIIEGFDYYVSDEISIGTISIGKRTTSGKYEIGILSNKDGGYVVPNSGDGFYSSDIKKVIATNNPNIDIPKVVNEVENIIKNAFYDENGDFKRSTIGADDWVNGLKLGYNKVKETYKFTEQDMIDFGKHCITQFMLFQNKDNDYSQRLLPEWKPQQPITIYYK